MKFTSAACLLLPSLGFVHSQKMATSHGQRLAIGSIATPFRILQDCSGQGSSWGPGIGPPPAGCEGGAPPSGDTAPASSGVGGSTSSNLCSITSGTCNTDGSSSSVDRSNLNFDADSGKFQGTFVTNQCNDHVREFTDGDTAPGNNAVSCIEQTLPTTTTTPSAIPTLGMAGLTLSGGVNIYSAFEAGFNDCATDGMPCACDGASCAAGMDVGSCEAHLEHECDEGTLETRMFMDTCGGHADPYHM